MKKEISLFKAGLCIIAAAVLLFSLAVRPFHLIRHRMDLTYGEYNEFVTDYVLEIDSHVVSFTPELTYLESISLQIWNEDSVDFCFKIVDNELRLLFEENFRADSDAVPGYFSVPVHLTLEPGKLYHCIVGGLDEGISIGRNMNIYHYSEVCSPKRTAFMVSLAVLSGIILGALWYLILRLTGLHLRRVKVSGFAFSLGTVISAVLTLVFLAQIWIFRTYGSSIPTRSLLSLGVVLTSAFTVCILYCVDAFGMPGEFPGLRFILISFFLGCAFIACIYYQNALSEYEHYLHIRRMLLALGAGIICTFDRRELLRWTNLILLLCGVPAAIFYRNYTLASGGDVLLTNLEAIDAVIWLVIFINCLGLLLRSDPARIIKKIRLPLCVLLFLFMLLISIFTYGRVWTITLSVIMLLFYIRLLLHSPEWLSGNTQTRSPGAVTEDSHSAVVMTSSGSAGVCLQKKKYYSSALVWGIYISFIYIIIFSLLYRPYHYYIHYRYQMIFHTVTITSVYLSLVCSVSAASMLGVLREAQQDDTLTCADAHGRLSVLLKQFSLVWPHLLMFGLSCGYQFLTLSRTGYISVFLSMIVMTVVLSMGQASGKIRKAGVYAAWSAAVFIWLFPGVFSFQRMIPALVNQPFVYSIEPFSESILWGDPADSPRYMTLERFLHLMNLRFGTEGTSAVRGTPVPDGHGIPLEYREAGPLQVSAGPILLAAEDTDASSIDANTYSNGRLSIFRAYISGLGLKGHDDMGMIMEDGRYCFHAHNSFIQMAHDHGIPIGIIFILLCGTALWYAVRSVSVPCTYSVLPLGIIAAFGITSLSEWIFHLCNPVALAFMLILGLLLEKTGKIDNTDKFI